jgi:hypothetical protein
VLEGRPASSFVVVAASAALILPGCSEREGGDVQGVAAELAASVLRPQAEDAFDRKGHPVRGRLSCGRDPDRPGLLAVACTGVTRDGAAVRFQGSVDAERIAGQRAGDDGVPGYFLGFVGGAEVFRMTCFGCAPANGPADPADPASGPTATASPVPAPSASGRTPAEGD